jgi:hypothetical protein
MSGSLDSKDWNDYFSKFTVNLDDYIVKKNTIIDRNISILNFREIISLIFHAVGSVAEKGDILDDPIVAKAPVKELSSGLSSGLPSEEKWIKFHEEFVIDLEAQNTRRWPKLSYIRNDFRKRLEVFSTTSYHSSRNLLILILRLLHIETFKLKNLPQNPDYHEILTHTISIPDKYVSNKVSMVRLFEILKLYVQYYCRIYHNEMMYEYALGKSIVDQI